MIASVPDLLRLLAVPVFVWAAYVDLRTRRIPDAVWLLPVAIGVGLLAWEGWIAWTSPDPLDARLYLLRAGVSVILVGGLGVVFYGLPAGFGGADAKAIVAVALLFPTYPAYQVAGVEFPLQATRVGVFSLTLLTNAVVLNVAYPLALLARNLVAGDVGPLMPIGRRVAWRAIPETHGKLLEGPDGYRLLGGLDLDSLRMYLRWRGTTLDAIRSAPEEYRDPASIDATGDPGDGRVRTDGGLDDPWGAERFLDAHDSYGTTPEGLRAGLEVLASRDRVWVSPGTPFLVPLFLGLVVGLVYGDLVFGLLAALGIA